MPELAEVEFYRKRWHLAAHGEVVAAVLTHDRKQVFRGMDVGALRTALEGATFIDSEARAKQMLFHFRREDGAAGGQDLWLGIHLGMTGDLNVQPPSYRPGKHDHLVIVTRPVGTEGPSRSSSARGAAADTGHALVFNDPRMFGRIQFHAGPQPPEWWTSIAPALLSSNFTVKAVAEFLQRRRRAPIKAVLLMQERFPGIGNWMADEILWRAAIHPGRSGGSLSPAETRRLWRECRHVCELALNAIAGRGDELPRDLNVNIPQSWLFRHRWQRGGKDPRTGTPLKHATIGGRTTCWSPARQPESPVGSPRAPKPKGPAGRKRKKDD